MRPVCGADNVATLIYRLSRNSVHACTRIFLLLSNIFSLFVHFSLYISLPFHLFYRKKCNIRIFFTFMLPYIVIDFFVLDGYINNIVIDFFLNNQPNALIIPILFC